VKDEDRPRVSPPGGRDGGRGGEDGAGTPVTLLAELREVPSGRFRGRVRRGIDRRLLGGQALDLTWSGPIAVLLEYMKMLFQVFRRENDGPGEEGEE
jgi:hypothetical protein